ncbi:hypothetical protein BVC71_14810 [Marivivens niveibacter]|uniref:GAF domain-containing protein n=1 Tax=Marivivens niveibacter TaxID=1930667 RepID=A0A251WVT1_9RHOB|nr:hypothetical protein [Marivivens niveibacter]OUD08228.1 hypothetical protein BVC71_14810 [Marivivens niveibacter]
MHVPTFTQFLERHGVTAALRELQLDEFFEFDDLLRVLCDATGREIGSVSLISGNEVHLIGTYRLQKQVAVRSFPLPKENENYLHFKDAGKTFPNSPLLNGVDARIRSVSAQWMRINGVPIGAVSIMSTLNLEPLDAVHRVLLAEFASLCTDLIERRARLKLMTYQIDLTEQGLTQ